LSRKRGEGKGEMASQGIEGRVYADISKRKEESLREDELRGE